MTVTNRRTRRIQQLGAPIPTREDRDWVTSTELEAQACITYRQLDYWCRTALLIPMDDATPGTGQVRRFDQAQIDRAHLIRVLLDSGMTLPTVRQVIDDLQQNGTATTGALTITYTPGDAA